MKMDRVRPLYFAEKPRRVSRPQTRKNSDRFSPRHVRGEKHISGCNCASEASAGSSPQTFLAKVLGLLRYDRKGSASVLFIGVTFALLCFTFLLLELGSAMERYDYVTDVILRSCNSAVEKNILDQYRADRILKMDCSGAESDFRSFLRDDLPAQYSVSVQAVRCTETPPGMTVSGTLTLPALFAQYGKQNTFPFTVRATNYDLD